MYSIREKLNITLILVLVAISVSFIVFMVGLFYYGIVLTPEAYAQIIAALATLLVVVLTLGLRLIDDTLDRYEKFALPRIGSLKSTLGIGGTKSELEGVHLYNLPARSRDLAKASSDLAKYGRFFLTKLYPQESLKKIARICSDLDEFLALVKSIEPYWKKSDFDSFLEFSIRGDIANLSGLSYVITLQEAKEAVAKLNGEKPELINQTRKLRERILLEIEKATDELSGFLEAN